MDLESTQNNALVKLPLLKQEDGNSFKPVARTTTNADGTSTSTIPGTVTAEEKIQRCQDRVGCIEKQIVVMKPHRKTNDNPCSLLSTASSTDNTARLSDATIYAFLANQPNGSQVVHEDLEQIHEDDLEEMDLKWQLALLRHFTRECRNPRSQENRSRNQDSSRRNVNVEESSSKSMLAIDGAGVDWSYMTEEEVPTNFALMAFSDSDIERLKKGKEIAPPPTGLFAPPTIDLSNSGLEEFKQPEFEGYRVKGTGQREVRPVWNNAMRTNHQNFSNSRRNFAPTAVLTKSGLVPISAARNLNNKVNTVKVNYVNTAKGKRVTSVVGEQGNDVVKSKACWVWRPKFKAESSQQWLGSQREINSFMNIMQDVMDWEDIDDRMNILSVLVVYHTTNGHQFTMSNRHQELASPEQTVSGKDFSNPLIVDSLLKTIWFINAPCFCNEALAIPGQTATGKELSNPLMADSLPKTILSTKFLG
ncbi:hypothetical protein Tco_0975268 [Tanacetum coccineum]|uniref:Uncharacterized protein n=1 Tax=Tanacetum coccineum TaxID=301880 RepID=A0ABQ5EDW8_9ASTR